MTDNTPEAAGPKELTDEQKQDLGRRLVSSMQNGLPGFDPDRVGSSSYLPLPTDESTRLPPPHIRRIVALHVNGFSNNEIATALNTTPRKISDALRTKGAQGIISRISQDWDAELSALMGTANAQMRKFVSSSNPDVALKAIDMLYKVLNKYHSAGQPQDSAEDVLQRVVEMVSTMEGPGGQKQIGVRVVDSRRKVIDIEPNEGE